MTTRTWEGLTELSTPPPEPPPRFSSWLTPVFTIALIAFAGFLFLLPRGADELERLQFPAECAGRMVDRHLEFYEGYEAVPTWERAIFGALFGGRAQVSKDAVSIYREVLEYFRTHPEQATSWGRFNIQTRLLITLAERGDRKALQQELDALGSGLDEEITGNAIRFAYGGTRSGAPEHEIHYGARLLPLGWAFDRLEARIAERLGHERVQKGAENRLEARGAELRTRVLILAGTVAGLMLLGLGVLARGRSLERPPAWQGLVLERPWSLSMGFAVIVRAALLGLIISVAFVMLFARSYFQPGVLVLWSTLFASLPMLWLIHRYLLRPRGMSFRSGFGLTMRGVGPVQFTKITLAVLALDWCGSLLIAWLGWKFGLNGHWSEGLYEQAIFGPWETAVLGAVNAVLWAPIFEEIGFRGLVYPTLRARFNPRVAILASAFMFSALHLYSLSGFLAVFWSGLVLAYAFERFRSLLPGMVAHAAGNLLAVNIILLFYR